MATLTQNRQYILQGLSGGKSLQSVGPVWTLDGNRERQSDCRWLFNNGYITDYPDSGGSVEIDWLITPKGKAALDAH